MRTLIALVLFCCGCTLAANAAGDNATRASQLADLKIVRDEYLPNELAYTDATRAQAAKQLASLEQRAGSLSPADLLVGLARIGALADNAHSGVRFGDPRALPARRLPLRLLWFPDALIVARATGVAADLAGARVLEIEGLTPDALYERIQSLQGGSAINRRKYLPTLMELPGVLHAAGVARRPDRIRFKLQLRSGKVLRRTLQMVANDTVSATAEDERLWLPQPIANETGWTSALSPDSLPLYLTDAQQPFRSVPMPELDALYIQLRSNQDEPGQPIAEFTKAVEGEIATRKPRHLILDLRFDVGGNLLTTLKFMRGLPATVSGRSFLLVGHYTYSAGIVSAAAVKKSGGAQVTIIGDDLGDRLAFWSEGANVTLPNSFFAMRYTNGTFDLADGCAAVPQCLDHLIEVNPVSLQPDVRAPLTSAAYLRKRDPALEAVREALAGPGPDHDPAGNR